MLTETRCLLSSDQPGAARLCAARPPLHQRADGLVHHGQPRLAQVGVHFLMRTFDEEHIGNDLQTGQVGVQFLMRSFDEWHIGNDLQTG